VSLKTGTALKDLKKFDGLLDKAGKGLEKTQDRAKKTSESIKKFASESKDSAGKVAASVGIITAAITAASKVTFDFVKGWAEATDEVAKASEKFNIPFAELQKLQHAAELGGAEVQDLRDGIKDLSIFISEATNDAAHPFNVALAQMGVSLKDLEGKTKTQQLGVLGDALNRVEDDAKRTELSVKVLGEAGLRLGSLLKTGSKGINAAANELEDLGLVLGDDAAKEAANFNDELLRTTKLTKAIGQVVASKLSPEVRKLVTEFKTWIIANRDMIQTKALEWFQKLVGLVRRMIPAVMRAARAFSDIFSVLNDVVGAIGGIEPALKTAGIAFVTFKAVALAALGPIKLAIAALTIGIGATLAKVAAARREQQRLANTAFDPVADRASISDVELQQSAAGRRVIEAELDVKEMQRLLREIGKGKTSEQVRQEVAGSGILNKLRSRFFVTELSKKELSLAVVEGLVEDARKERAKALLAFQGERLAKDRKAAEKDRKEFEAQEELRKEFGALQRKLLNTKVKLTKQELKRLKQLEKLIPGATIIQPTAAGAASPRSAKEAVEKDKRKSLQEKVAELLGLGSGLSAGTFRPSGLGSLVQHIDARVFFGPTDIDVTLKSDASGEALGRDVANGIAKEHKANLQRAFAAQRGQIRG
jgi:hypothetical protein